MKRLSVHPDTHFNNVLALSSSLTISAVSELWLEEVALLRELEQIAPATERAYRYAADLFANHAQHGGGEHIPLTEFALREIDQRVVWSWYRKVREGHGLSAAYWGLQRLRTLLSFARRSGLMHGDPTAGLRPRRGTKPTPALTPEELRTLVAQIVAAYAEALAAGEARGLTGRALAARLSMLAVLLVLVGTGARVSEICKAHCWQFEGSRLFLPRTKTRRDRRVGVGENCRRVLALQVALIDDPRARMFPGPKSPHVTQPGVWKALQVQAERAGIRPISPHGLRHTFVRNNLNAGTKPKMLSWQLGHKRAEMLWVYAEGALPPDAAASADVIEEIAGGGEPWSFDAEGAKGGG